MSQCPAQEEPRWLARACDLQETANTVCDPEVLDEEFLNLKRAFRQNGYSSVHIQGALKSLS
jgi:hypothetical protein